MPKKMGYGKMKGMKKSKGGSMMSPGMKKMRPGEGMMGKSTSPVSGGGIMKADMKL